MALADKLSQIYQKASVPKRGRNEYFKYSFATAEDVFATIRAELSKLRVFMLSTIDDVSQAGVQTSKGTSATHTRVHVTVTFLDGESGETLSASWFGESIDTEDKGIQKAVTSAIKYCLMKQFLISEGGDDPDAESTEIEPPKHEEEPKRPAKAPKAKAPGGEPIADVLKRLLPGEEERNDLKSTIQDRGWPMAEFVKEFAKAYERNPADFGSAIDVLTFALELPKLEGE